MKRFKNISLVYALQIIAVLILFFYPDYSSKAALKEFAINNKGIVGSDNISLSNTVNSAIPLSKINLILPGSNQQMLVNNQFKKATDEDYALLRKKYGIDASSLIEIRSLHLNLSSKPVDSISK